MISFSARGLFFVQNEIGRWDELFVAVRVALDRFLAQHGQTALDQRAERLIIERSLSQQICNALGSF